MEVLVTRKLSLLLFSYQILFSWAAEVSTPLGKIFGSEDLRTKNGRLIYSFTGIPYALPPVGELRFQEARPAEPWTGSFDASKDGNDCPQYDDLGRGSVVTGREDCLILNVYSPEVNSSAKLPVMVWIHGGGFVKGSGRLYGPEFLLDKDIVLVSFNYRLSVLGFLTTCDEVIPANIGLKDQALALKWVHNNIENFGGDPGLVTLFGESSGGVSTHLSLLSPLVKGLFHRAIAMSGTGSVSSPPKELVKVGTEALALSSGCPSEPPQEMLKCLQTVPVETLLRISQKSGGESMGISATFRPMLEAENVTNAFITNTTNQNKTESEVPFMTGIVSGEGLDLVSKILTFGDQNENYLNESLQSNLPMLLKLRAKFPKEQIPAVTEQIQKFYFGDKPIDRNSTQELIEVITDTLFLTRMLDAALEHSGDTFFYYYDYRQSVSYTDIFGNDIKGVHHGDSVLSLFPLTDIFPNRAFSDMDIKVIDKVVDIWTNFAKQGNLTDVTKWTPTTGVSTNSCLLITGEEPSVEEKTRISKRIEFWKSLLHPQQDSSEPSGSQSHLFHSTSILVVSALHFVLFNFAVTYFFFSSINIM